MCCCHHCDHCQLAKLLKQFFESQKLEQRLARLEASAIKLERLIATLEKIANGEIDGKR